MSLAEKSERQKPAIGTSEKSSTLTYQYSYI
jgi:hypothetical protein